MKELDFDELDRAVASALSESAPSAAAQADPAPGAVPATAPAAEAIAPIISSHAANARITARPGADRKSTLPLTRSAGPVVAPAAEEASESESAAPSARVIPHREGRAMDFVRPGRNQKKPAATPAVAPAPSAPMVQAAVDEPEAAVVPSGPTAPTNPSLEAAINELLLAEGHAVSGPTPNPAVVETPAPPPDILAPETMQPETSAPEPSNDDSVDEIAAALETTPAPESTPAATPFLPGAQVEKRPLGSADLPTYEPLKLPNDAPVADETQPVSPLAMEEEPETPLPAELQEDLLAIESGASQPLETPASEVAPEVSELAAETAEVATPETPAPAGPTSIARQYKDTLKQASEDDESGAIFDPQTYGQPAADPVKKSSVWKWLIALVVLVIIAVPFAWLAWMSGVLPVPL